MSERPSGTVSVVIPTYNFGRFLPEAIQSVRGRTYGDVEIVVVDDGSTDETPEVLEKLDGPDLRWRRTPNRGVSSARNLGLRLSDGEYVAFLDADDRWHPEKLERQVQLLDYEPEVGFAFCDFTRFDRGGTFEPTQFDLIPGMEALPAREAEGGGRVVEGDVFEGLISLSLCPIYPSTLLVRGPLARKIEFPVELRLSQDLYYFLQLYQRSRAGFLTDPLVEIRRHEENLSGPTLAKRLADIEVLRKFRREAAIGEYDEVLARELADRLAGLGYDHFWNARYLASARAYLKCLTYPGRRLNALLHLAALPAAPLIRAWSDRS